MMDDLISVLEEIAKSSKTTRLLVEILIKLTLLVMRYIRGTHECDYALCIHTAECMLPYVFAAGPHNYSRYGLYFVQSMSWLPDQVLEGFLKV